jgi:hypothetical protein
LVAWYKFEEPSALDTIIDATDYGHNATVSDSGTTDSTRVGGIVGNCVQINTSNAGSRFVLADNSDINVAGKAVSVCGWVRIIADDINNLALIGIFEKGGFRLTKQGSVTPPNCFDLRINNDERVRTGTIVGDTWYHVAATWNGTTTMKIYLNGSLINTTTVASTSLTDSATPLQVVGTSANGMRTGNRMDEWRFYTRLLSDAEVTAIYNDEAP